MSQVRARSDVTVVTDHVDDVNDNSPTFVFPNSVNNTVHVTSAAVSTTSPGHLLVAVCEAIDADDGPNARVAYEIANASSGSSDRFRIGRTSGRLTMRVGRAESVSGGSGGGSENATLSVVVRARDDGWPSRSTTATLHVVVVNTATVFEGDHWNVWSDSQAGASSTHSKNRSIHVLCIQ